MKRIKETTTHDNNAWEGANKISCGIVRSSIKLVVSTNPYNQRKSGMKTKTQEVPLVKKSQLNSANKRVSWWKERNANSLLIRFEYRSDTVNPKTT